MIQDFKVNLEIKQQHSILILEVLKDYHNINNLHHTNILTKFLEVMLTQEKTF